MDFRDIEKRALVIRDQYNRYNRQQGNRPWGVAEHAQGFIGDAGDLIKLIMAQGGYRSYPAPYLKEKLSHELADCLWSIMVISDELGIDLQ